MNVLFFQTFIFISTYITYILIRDVLSRVSTLIVLAASPVTNSSCRAIKKQSKNEEKKKNNNKGKKEIGIKKEVLKSHGGNKSRYLY